MNGSKGVPDEVRDDSNLHPERAMRGRDRRRLDDSPLATKLGADLARVNGVTRWLLWFEALEKAQPADFPRLARLANGDATTLRLLALRWIDLDPRHCLKNLPQPRSGAVDEIAWVLFQEWPKRDPEAVIAELNRPENSGHRHYWDGHIVEAVLEKDVERGLRLLCEWNIEHFSPRMHPVAKWATENPRHAAEFTMAHPSGASDVALKTIGKEWGRIDPRAAVEFAVQRPTESGYHLAEAAMKVWTENSLPHAADWLATVEPQRRNRLSSAFAEEWAKTDAASALDWCEANLTGSSLKGAVARVLKGAAERDVSEAASMVTSMSPSMARAEAARAVAEKWLPHWSAEDRKAKPEAIAWLSGLDRQSAIRVLEMTQGWWTSSDPKSLIEFLSNQRHDLPPDSYNVAVRHIVGENPRAAIEWASQLPEAVRLPVGARAFSEWRSAQSETAMNWLNDLPPNDLRRRPFFETAIRDLAYDGRAPEHLAAMGESDRKAARKIIAVADVPEDKRAALLNATRIE